MQRFTTKIVNMMKAERLYESQGGPIILSQVSSKFFCTDKIDSLFFMSALDFSLSCP